MGAFSFLDENTTVLYFGYNEDHIVFDWVKPRPSQNIRLNELANLKNALGFEYILLDHKINNYHVNTIIADIEKTINYTKPDIVLLPNPTYNQDHRSVYEAALTALRPHDINHFVKIVLIYEQVQDLWDNNYHTFKPVYFNPISINDKLQAYKFYKSQTRSFRNDNMITTLARLRGIQSNSKYSEAFEVLRWVK